MAKKKQVLDWRIKRELLPKTLSIQMIYNRLNWIFSYFYRIQFKK